MQQDGPFDTIRDLVARDLPLQDSLAALAEPRFFAETLRGRAAAAGIELAPGVFESVLPTDPLMVLTPGSPPWIVSDWPPPAWRPVRVVIESGEIWVDWAHFGGRSLTESFFEDSARIAARRPFNRLFGRRMRLDDFVAGAAKQVPVRPDGFIFHMSRCGSTLVSRMLAALDRSIVVSEAPPLDAMVQLDSMKTAADGAVAAVQAMIAALGRPFGGEQRLFLKLDAWHSRALPLFAKAFPVVPWVFLFRDPVEVLASQALEPGMQVVPGMLPSHIFGIDPETCGTQDEYGARALAAICNAALDHRAEGLGLFVNYADLPQAVAGCILPHFGIAPREAEIESLRLASTNDAKTPQLAFERDVERKQRDASERTRMLASRFLAASYRRLEALSRTRG